MANTKAFLANVMNAYVYSGDQLLFTSKALTDSSISIGVNAEEVRGGKGNKLIGRYFHDSTFSLELQDALFNLDYIAKNVGASISAQEGGILAEEQVTATASGALTVSGVPQDFFDKGKIGWIAEVGEDTWYQFAFADDSSSATNVVVGSTPIAQGTAYCVKYMKQSAIEEVTVPADIVPDEVTVILKGDLYKASKGNDVSTSSIIGHIEIEVPRFQLNGSMDISLNSSGASQIPFAGNALVTEDANAGCEGGGYYAVIKKFDETSNWYDSLVALAMEGQDGISVVTGGAKVVRTYGVFSNGSSRLIDPSKLTYTLTPTTLGTMNGATGAFTAGSTVATGDLTISVANKATVTAIVPVAVTGE